MVRKKSGRGGGGDGREKLAKLKMAVATAEGLAALIREGIKKYDNGDVWLEIENKGLLLSDLDLFERALLLVFAEETPRALVTSKIGFTNGHLLVLSRVISRFPAVQEALEGLQFWNEQITSLEPLTEAGLLENLDQLLVNDCLLSGEFPVQLAQNLPNLNLFWMNRNKSSSKFIFPVEALCILPSECILSVDGAEPAGFYLLDKDNGEREYKKKTNLRVREILESLGVKCSLYKQTLVKPARTTKARCGSCASPRPKYACAGCKAVTYCNKKCQAEDWLRHQRACAPSSPA